MSNQDSEWYVIVDDQSPRIQYNGKWFNEVAQNAFNSSLSITATSGSSAVFKFRGNYVAARGAVLFPNATNPPITAFSIDGQSPAVFVPLLSDNGTIPVTFFVSPQLSDGDHTLTITSLNDGAPFFLDYILFNATSTAMVTSTSASVQPTIIQTVIVAATSAPDTLDTAAASKSVPIGPIIGGVVGGVALLVATLIALYFLCWRRRYDGPYYHVASLSDPEHKRVISPFVVTPSQTQQTTLASPVLPIQSSENDIERSVYSAPSQYLPTEFVSSPSATSQPPFPPTHGQMYPPVTQGRRASSANTPTADSGALSSPITAPLTAAQRKRAEAARRAMPDPLRHTDSGMRFDRPGASPEAPAGDPEDLAELPPSYSAN